jgi:hypothetical protein
MHLDHLEADNSATTEANAAPAEPAPPPPPVPPARTRTASGKTNSRK